MAVEDLKYIELSKLPKTEDASNLFIVASREGGSNDAVTYPMTKIVEKIESITTNDKGYFSTEAGLKAAWPFPAVGNYANVKGYIYECRTMWQWTNTGTAAPTPELNLSEYAKANNTQGDSVVYAPSGVILSASKGQDETKAPNLKLFSDELLARQKIILNVSQMNNKYDYSNNSDARNSVPSGLRSRGQAIRYFTNIPLVIKRSEMSFIDGYYLAVDGSYTRSETNFIASFSVLGYSNLYIQKGYPGNCYGLYDIDGRLIKTVAFTSGGIGTYFNIAIPSKAASIRYSYPTDAWMTTNRYNIFGDVTLSGSWVNEMFNSATISDWSNPDNWITEPRYESFTDNILKVENIDYKEVSSDYDFINLITTVNNVQGYLDATGQIVTGTDNTFVTNTFFVPAKENTLYLANISWGKDNCYVCFYDASKNFIGRIYGMQSPRSFTTIAGTAFVRYTLKTGAIADKPYMYAAPVPVTSNEVSVIMGVENLTGAKQVEIAGVTGNILPSGIQFASGFIDINGNYNTTSGFNYSVDYIPIDGNTDYTTNLYHLAPIILFYDSGKNFISPIGTVVGDSPFGDFATPVNARFFRFNTKSTDMNGKYVLPKSSAKKFTLPNLYLPQSNIYDGSAEKLKYYALGDSLTVDNSYALKIATRHNFDLTNLAIGGKMAMGDDGLILQVNQVPAGFTGLVTCMIGTNDRWQSRPLGDADAAIAMNYNNLSLNVDFAQAYRYCMETLMKRCPEAIILCMTPLPTSLPNIEPYREVERKINKYLSIPIFDIGLEICLYDGNIAEYGGRDGVHVDDRIQSRVARVFGGRIKTYIN